MCRKPGDFFSPTEKKLSSFALPHEPFPSFKTSLIVGNSAKTARMCSLILPYTFRNMNPLSRTT